jgi:hypothetical protein
MRWNSPGAAGITWWPSDYNQKHLESIAAWRHHSESSRHSPAPAHRSPRSRVASAAGRKPDGRRAAGDSLCQCHPYRALADRREPAGRRRAPAAARRPAVPLRALHEGGAAYVAQQCRIRRVAQGPRPRLGRARYRRSPRRRRSRGPARIAAIGDAGEQSHFGVRASPE